MPPTDRAYQHHRVLRSELAASHAAEAKVEHAVGRTNRKRVALFDAGRFACRPQQSLAVREDNQCGSVVKAKTN